MIALETPALRPCPEKPNCVCSQAPPGHRAHVPPIALGPDPADEYARLVKTACALPRTQLVRQSPGYHQFECRSAFFRFADDLDLLLDSSSGVCHVRSASRIGLWDFGVNRRRVERLRRAFETPTT